jgi:hypothetical protein
MANVEVSLGRTEKVLWTGAPSQGLLLRRADLFMVPFSLLWAGFVVTFFLSTKRAPAGGPPLLFEVFFAAAALYITVGRFAADAWRRARTTYAVTNERVIIQSGSSGSTVQSVNLRTLVDVTLSERRDGRGTITFGPTDSWGAWRGMRSWSGAPGAPTFEGIPDARGVYDMIRGAQRTASAGPA